MMNTVLSWGKHLSDYQLGYIRGGKYHVIMIHDDMHQDNDGSSENIYGKSYVYMINICHS